MPPLYPAKQTVAFNPVEGYDINYTTGDSIQPLINSFGETVRTGIPVQVTGKSIHSDSVAQPLIIPEGEPMAETASLNALRAPDALVVIPVDKKKLRTFTRGVDTSTFVLRNSIGKTIPTALPIPITGRVVPSKQPQAVMALPPRMKDNSSINIKYMDVEQGMNSSFVLAILEDSHGNLWFGTELGGVIMYNGKS